MTYIYLYLYFILSKENLKRLKKTLLQNPFNMMTNKKHDLFLFPISHISNRNMNQCFVFIYVFCLTLISLPIYSKNFLNLRFVPLLGLIFNYIYNSRKVLATPLFLEVSVPCQEGELRLYREIMLTLKRQT
jgi:hypothetical protein